MRVGSWLVTRRQRNFRVEDEDQGRKFSLWEMQAGKWRAFRKTSTGKPIRKQFYARDLGVAVERAEGLLYGSTRTDGPEDLSIGTVLGRWFKTKSNRRKNTCTDYKQSVKMFLNYAGQKSWESWSGLRLEHLQEYQNDLQGYSYDYIRLRLFPIRSCARWAAANWPDKFRDFGTGFTLVRPDAPVLYEDQEEGVALTVAEVLSFLWWVQEFEPGMVCGVALQGLCGLRLTEVVRMAWEQVDLEDGTITIEGVLKNKWSLRRLPVPRIVLNILRQASSIGWRVSHYADWEDYSKKVSECLKRWRPDLDIKPKDLRNTLPTVATDSGWYTYDVRRYLGHAPVDVTERAYIKRNKKQLLEIFRQRVVPKIDEEVSAAAQKEQQKSSFENVVHLRVAVEGDVS